MVEWGYLVPTSGTHPTGGTMATTTTTARHIVAGMHLLAVEDVPIGQPDQGVLIEATRWSTEEGLDIVGLSVWHSTWMFGIELDSDDRVTVIHEAAIELPEAPSREGLVRVHGTWKLAGEVHWAPMGYPSNPNRVRRGEGR